MAVGEFGKDPLHGGLPENGRTGLDSETAAIFHYCGHFAVIEIDDLTVSALQRFPAPLENVRIDCRSLFLLSGQNLI